MLRLVPTCIRPCRFATRRRQQPVVPRCARGFGEEPGRQRQGNRDSVQQKASVADALTKSLAGLGPLRSYLAARWSCSSEQVQEIRIKQILCTLFDHLIVRGMCRRQQERGPRGEHEERCAEL